MSNDKKKPVHPGEVLYTEFLKAHNITQLKLARHLGCSHSKISEVISKKRGITAETALGFAEALGTSADYWLELQAKFDLWEAKKKHKKVSKLFTSKKKR